MPCRHPANAEHGDTEPLPAPVSQRRRSSRCLHRLTWQGQERGAGQGEQLDAAQVVPFSSRYAASTPPPPASSCPRCPGRLRRQRCRDLGHSRQHPRGKRRLGLPPPRRGFQQPSISSTLPLPLPPAPQPRTPTHLTSERCISGYTGRNLGRGTGWQRLGGGMPEFCPLPLPTVLQLALSHAVLRIFPVSPWDRHAALSRQSPPSTATKPAPRRGAQRQKGSSALLCRVF